MICPCKGCAKAGCGSFHDECEPYRSWRQEKDRENNARYHAHDLDGLSRDHEINYRKNLKKGWK